MLPVLLPMRRSVSVTVLPWDELKLLALMPVRGFVSVTVLPWDELKPCDRAVAPC